MIGINVEGQKGQKGRKGHIRARARFLVTLLLIGGLASQGPVGPAYL